MCGQLAGPPDDLLVELAARQENVVAFRQLAELGLSRRQIEHLLYRRRLQRRHRGVFSLGPAPLTPKGALWAAHLRAGEDSCVSHWSAAWLHNLASSTGRVEISSPRKLHIPGVTTYRSTPQTTAIHGLPTTTWPRTILDLAATEPPRTIERLLNEAEYQRLFDLPSLNALLRESNGHHGTGTLARALEKLTHGETKTDSDLEELFLALVDELGLPRPLTQVDLHGYRADFYWPQYRLVVELDSFGAHTTRTNFERDRTKDATYLRHGLRVLRITHRRLTHDRAQLAQDLLALTT